jgi:hypothetical protein
LIEQNMDAVAKTPKLHRSELMRFVHRPELAKVIYRTENAHALPLPLLDSLQAAYCNYDLQDDPYVLSLLKRRQAGENIENALQKLMLRSYPYCRMQLQKLCSKGAAMRSELGTSATDWYLHQCIFRYEDVLKGSTAELFDWTTAEKQHLSNIFRRLDLPNEPPPLVLDHLSDKVEKLIDTLVKAACEGFTGLVFVEQRVWVTALAEILALHPQTASLFNIGTYVGNSLSTKRKTVIADLIEPRNQQGTLDDFRAGKKNLILATSVLEEGIDISSCHLVICFETPKNLKSFIQRRGRARKQHSDYIVMLSESDAVARSPQKWQNLEQEMINEYMQDRSIIEAAEARENVPEEGSLFYRVASTG